MDVTPQIDHLRKTSPVLMVSTHIYRVSQEIDRKASILRVNLVMWPPNWLSWKIESCSKGFNTTVWGSKEIDGKTSILIASSYITMHVQLQIKKTIITTRIWNSKYNDNNIEQST